jgi:hypothetical protein
MIISNEAATALRDACVTRGTRKGQLKASAPPSSSMAYAAWQGAMLSINPYKASIAGMMFMSTEQRAICDEITKLFDAMKAQGWRVGTLDRDRAALEALGVW